MSGNLKYDQETGEYEEMVYREKEEANKSCPPGSPKAFFEEINLDDVKNAVLGIFNEECLKSVSNHEFSTDDLKGLIQKSYLQGYDDGFEKGQDSIIPCED